MPDFDSTSIYGLDVKYLFTKYPLSTFGKGIERRLKSSPDLIEGFISDTTGEYDLLNLYDSSSQNSIMIDKLIDYRLGNTVSLDDVVYEEINYTLAKLIYIYLDLMVNGNYLELDTTNTISSDASVVDNLFELYVLNESHKLIKTWKTFADVSVTELRPVRKKFVLDTSSVETGYLTITSEIPNDPERMYLYKNGELQPQSYYSYTSDSTSLTISIDSTGTYGLNLVSGDIIVLDSFVAVNPINPAEILE